MPNIVGGLRARLIRESLYEMLYAALDDLDWYNPTRKHRPIIFNSEPVDPAEPVEFNTIAIQDSDIEDFQEEMGSLLSEHRWTFYVDVFAESDALALHLIRDLRDALEGRYASIGRDRPILDVYDPRQATPEFLFTCQIEDAMIDRTTEWIRPHQAHWYSCQFQVVDYYGDEVV